MTMSPTSSQSSQMDIETRFSHLLNPIRDLAKNWNINLSSNLEEYLAELGNVELVFDNGKTTMNFAQAALLIQGSACVYSKKVEYIYNLAYEILKIFTNRKTAQKGSEKQADDGSTSQVENDAVDEFLSLDDIEVDNNLEKKEEELKNKRLSFKYLSRTPTVLTPSEIAVKGDVMLYNCAGDLIGNKNDFQVNVSKIHSSGLLVIDTTIAAETMDMKCSSFDAKIQRTEPVIPADNITDDCFDGGGCPSPMMSDCGDLPEMPPSPLKDDDDAEIKNAESPRRSLRVQKAKEELSPPPKTTPLKEPLKLLDPYDETKALIKPIKKSRRCILPESLEKESEKPKRKKSKLKEKLESVSEFCSLQFEKKGRNKCKTFKEFENHFWKEMDRRKEFAAKKQARKLAREAKQSENCQESDQDDAHSDGFVDDAPFDDDMLGPDLGNVIDNVADNSLEKEDFEPKNADLPKDDNVVIQSYEDLVREHVDKYMSSASNYAQLSDLGKRVKEWEDRIKPRLEAEDKHESYDIHVYGSRILETFNKKEDKELTFGAICDGKPKYEICRLFLASLQLANNYNVEISTSGPLDSGVDTMALTILSSNRHHEELQDYRAPSII